MAGHCGCVARASFAPVERGVGDGVGVGSVAGMPDDWEVVADMLCSQTIHFFCILQPVAVVVPDG